MIFEEGQNCTKKIVNFFICFSQPTFEGGGAEWPPIRFKLCVDWCSKL